MEPFIGEIRQFAGNFAPKGWAMCNGQILLISSNTILFSILSTTFGGNGKTTFALPNLGGQVPVGMGQGPGLTMRQIGEQLGDATVTLTETELPSHSHAISASDAGGNAASPAGHVWARTVDGRNPGPAIYNNAPNTSMHPQALGVSGGGQAHNNMQPWLALNFIIALEGIFPQRP
jgi:microcystin-dependent protein